MQLTPTAARVAPGPRLHRQAVALRGRGVARPWCLGSRRACRVRASPEEPKTDSEGAPDTARDAALNPSEGAPEQGGPSGAAAAEEDIIASKELISELLEPSALGTRGEGWVAGQLLAVVLLAAPPTGLTGVVDALAAAGLLGGAALMASAFLGLGRNLSPLPEPRKKHELVVSGVYGYARHPMYGGFLLFAIALAALTHSEGRLAAAALLWWVLENKVALEERALLQRYPEYAEYQQRVRKFLPYIY